MTNNDAPLTDAEQLILTRAGYVFGGGGLIDGKVQVRRRKDGVTYLHTRAEWRAIIADLPDFWSPASRAEIRAAVATLGESELRELLDAVLSINDPALLVATLRGAALGLAGRVKKEGKR
jgi:ABC-type enterobactin transport system permease subunit